MKDTLSDDDPEWLKQPYLLPDEEAEIAREYWDLTERPLLTLRLAAALADVDHRWLRRRFIAFLGHVVATEEVPR